MIRIASPAPCFARAVTPGRGFTLVEVCIGMTVTALVLVALTTFAAALGDGWRSADGASRLPVQAAAVDGRMKRLFQPAKYLAGVAGGSADPGDAPVAAHVVLWRDDNFDPGPGVASPAKPGDGVAQYGEVAVLEFDPAAGAVLLYQAKPVAAMTPAQRQEAARPLPRASLDDASFHAAFKAYRRQIVGSRNFLDAPRPVLGSTDPAATTRVTAAHFARADPPASADGPAARPTLEYWYATARDGAAGEQTAVVRGTVALWQPVVPTDPVP